MTNLIIIGAGGHGRVVADCAATLKKYQNIFFVDDCYPEQTNDVWPVIASVKNLEKHIKNAEIIVAFGNNFLRKKLHNQLITSNMKIATIIHPSAQISEHAIIEKGSVVFAQAVVNIGAHIKQGVIINTSASVDHDCIIESFSHISPGARLAGGVNVGQCAWLGIASCVIEGITIADNTQLGAGAVAACSTQANSLYLGVPAKRIRALKHTI